jgi:hypothetical protein
MIRRVAAALAGLVRENWTPDVHFHSGALGRPYVCGDPGCTAPHLNVNAH